VGNTNIQLNVGNVKHQADIVNEHKDIINAMRVLDEKDQEA